MLIEKIEEYYKERDLNCAETMLYAANDVYGLELDKKALKMAAGFGGECTSAVYAVPLREA